MSQAIQVEKAVVSLTTDSKDLKQGFQSAVAASNKAKSQILKAASVITAAFAGRTLFNNLLGADSLGKIATSLNTDVTSLDAWGKAVEDHNGSAEAFRNTLQTLNRGLQEVAKTGSGRAKTGLAALGIKATVSGNKAKNVIDVLDELSKKADTLDKAEFSGLAQKLGLDEGTIRTLQQGNKSLREQIDLLREQAVKRDDVKVAEEFNTALNQIKRSSQALANNIFRILIPPLSKGIKIFTQGITFLGKNKFAALAFVSTLASLIGVKLVLATKKWTASLLANPAVLLFTIIGALIAALIFAVQDLYTYFTGGESFFGDWIKTLEKLSPSEIFSELKDTIIGLFPPLRLVVELFDILINSFDFAREAFNKLGSFILAKLKEIINSPALNKLLSFLGFLSDDIDAGINTGVLDSITPELAAAASVPGADLNDLATIAQNQNSVTIGTLVVKSSSDDPAEFGRATRGAVDKEFNNFVSQSGSSTRG